jgi:hypothetical protein
VSVAGFGMRVYTSSTMKNRPIACPAAVLSILALFLVASCDLFTDDPPDPGEGRLSSPVEIPLNLDHAGRVGLAADAPFDVSYYCFTTTPLEGSYWINTVLDDSAMAGLHVSLYSGSDFTGLVKAGDTYAFAYLSPSRTYYFTIVATGTGNRPTFELRIDGPGP